MPVPPSHSQRVHPTSHNQSVADANIKDSLQARCTFLLRFTHPIRWQWATVRVGRVSLHSAPCFGCYVRRKRS